jgi:hypothetical protein
MILVIIEFKLNQSFNRLNITTCVVYGALEKWMVTCLPGLYQAIQIRAVRIREYSLGSMIQDRQTCYLDHTELVHAAIMQNLVLSRGELDQLQVASTNAVHLGDSHPSSQISVGHPFLPHQIQ